MTKYLIKASYTAEGTRGLLKKGGTNRKKAIDDMLKAVGGKLEIDKAKNMVVKYRTPGN